MSRSEEYDYIIVGAGSAGCTLAGRLSEDRNIRVLLLEAGGWDRSPWIHMPIGVGKMFPQQMYDWLYFTEPEANADSRRIECARGKVIGGSSSINVMAYVRGNRGDYDRWAGYGLDQWSYRHVLPYFRRQESWEGGADVFRGGDGPLAVRRSAYRDPIIEAFIEAGESAGHPVTPDYNGRQQEGFGRVQETIRNGRRCSAAVAYLRPALKRGNLRVEVNALVSRVVLRGSRAEAVDYRQRGETHAEAVDYRQRGETHVARAAREIILAGGVINSPQILMLSGIGDPDHLREHGIAPLVPLPGVGANLQDHLSCLVTFRRKDESPFHRAMRMDRLALSVAMAQVAGRGFASGLPIGATAFLKSHGGEALPDLQFLFVAAPFPARPYFRPIVQPVPDAFSCRVALLRPESRGSLRLASADPAAPPRIRQNFLATDRDKRTLRRGFRMVREVFAQARLASFVDGEIAPGNDIASDADIDRFIRATSITVHHPAGTCRMGAASDPAAVVDTELRVREVDNLRIVDGSVLPDLVGGNINAPIIMIAEKAADMIRGRPALPPAELTAATPTEAAS